MCLLFRWEVVGRPNLLCNTWPIQASSYEEDPYDLSVEALVSALSHTKIRYTICYLDLIRETPMTNKSSYNRKTILLYYPRKEPLPNSSTIVFMISTGLVELVLHPHDLITRATYAIFANCIIAELHLKNCATALQEQKAVITRHVELAAISHSPTPSKLL